MCVQYIRGYSVHRGCSLHQGVFSTLGKYHVYIRGVKYIGGYHECIGEGISWIHWGMFSTLGDIMMHVGDTMSTLGDVQYIRGYHEYIGGYHEYIGGIMSTSGFSIEIERIYQVTPPNASWYPLWCTEHPPMYSWYSPRFTHGISLMYWTSPNVHMVSPHIHNDIPWCTEHAPMYSWYPPMYWTSPNLLNTHYTGWKFYGCSFDTFIYPPMYLFIIYSFDTFETLLWYFCCYHGNHSRTRAVYLKTKKALLC